MDDLWMNAKTHATILKVITAITVIGGILLLGFVWLSRTDSAVKIFFISFAILIFLWPIVLRVVPVRCNRRGCNGRLNKEWIKISENQDRLQYVCSVCGEIFDTDVILRREDPW
jgi:hypothetical protein